MVSIKIAISKKYDGSMKMDDLGQTMINRKKFLQSNNLKIEDTALVKLDYNSQNFCRYSYFDNTYRGDGMVRPSTVIADAAATDQLNLALFLPLADCVGAVIYSLKHKLLMVSHLGRHNLVQYGGQKSIQFLIDKFNVDPKTLNVWLSPAAGKSNYPLYDFGGRGMHEVAIEQMKLAGIDSTNIKSSKIDVTLDDNYFSHSQYLKNKQPIDGRFAIVACLLP